MVRAPYPKRPSHFANKVVRLMLKTCAANDIGPEAVLLVTFIAHTEDAKHYREAVTYYNDQLMPVTGLATYNRLNRARQKAVDAGWLHYEAGGKSRPGRYWALIPGEYCGIPDSPSDEGEDQDCALDCSSILEGQTEGKRESNGEVNGRKAEGEAGDKHESSLPIPGPPPSPEEESAPSKPKKFVPPTAEQVAEYCQERGNSVDPQRFVNFYASKGWYVGKKKMEDWQAAVRTWESRDAEAKHGNRHFDFSGGAAFLADGPE